MVATLSRGLGGRGGWVGWFLSGALWVWGLAAASQVPPGLQVVESGRFTVAAAPHDMVLARSLLRSALARDTFPGLPRPRSPVLVVVAPDRESFRALVGPRAPEYGVAIAFPSEQRIVMQGRRSGSAVGDPVQVLRHELAHLALHEVLGGDVPRWFDEGYASFAAGEWGREEVLLTNVALAWRGVPSLEALEQAFHGGKGRAAAAYALAYRAVAELAALDRERGLRLLFEYWQSSGSLDAALRQAFGLTLESFEEFWRQQTRRRYGVLSFFTDVAVAAALMTLLVVPLYVVRRRRQRLRLEALARAEAEAARRERDSVLAALLEAAQGGEGRGSAGS